jgi:hypothetical protein
LQKEKSEGKRRELQAQLTRLQQQLNDEKVRRKSKQLEQEWKVSEGRGLLQMAADVSQYLSCVQWCMCCTPFAGQLSPHCILHGLLDNAVRLANP